jgi:beta propeller repeat protein
MRRFTLLFLAFAFVLAATLAAAAPTTAHALVTLSTTEQRLTTSLGDEYDPSISGNLVSYTSNRAGETETDVFAFDLSAGTEFPVADGPGWQEHSAVSAGRIAYSDLATADVIVYDVASGVRTNLTPDSPFAMNPGIDGDIVAWEDRRDGNYEIYAQDLATGEVRRLTNSPERDLRPDVSGTVIVWNACDATNVDMWAYDWATGVTTQITNTPALYERLADVSGNVVVYEANRDGDQDIYAYDLTTSTERRLALPGFQTNPNISGQCVVFEQLDAIGVYHVNLWYLPTDQVFDLTSGPSGQYLNDIDMLDATHGRVAYTDDRYGQLDIFMTEFELEYPNVSVPALIEFGNVATNASATDFVTIQNTGSAPLVVSDIALDPGALGVSIVTAPSLPAQVAPGSYIQVEVKFAPTAVGPMSATLKVVTDDPDTAVSTVPLTGTGVWSELPPEQQIKDLLAFFDTAKASGAIYGIGPGKSADGKAGAFRNKIDAVGDLIRSGDVAGAIDLLRVLQKECDGAAKPPDFVGGPARAELAAKVLKLITALGGTP